MDNWDGLLPIQPQPNVNNELDDNSWKRKILCAEVKSLRKKTIIMPEETKMMDPVILGEADTTQVTTDVEVSSMVYPLELKVAQSVNDGVNALDPKKETQVATTELIIDDFGLANKTEESQSVRRLYCLK